MDYPRWHIRFTRASNLLKDAMEEMEQAYFEDGRNPKFKKLYDAMYKLRHRCFVQWDRNCKRCKKMGCK